jgi:hypothetical protein
LGRIATESRSRIAQETFSRLTPGLSTPPITATPALPFVDPLTPPRTVGADPLTTPRGLTSFQPQVLGSAPPRVRTRQRTKQCECDEPKRKRQKRRKCRTRVGVVWASGPKKGQPAGTRCTQWEK